MGAAAPPCSGAAGPSRGTTGTGPATRRPPARKPGIRPIPRWHGFSLAATVNRGFSPTLLRGGGRLDGTVSRRPGAEGRHPFPKPHDRLQDDGARRVVTRKGDWRTHENSGKIRTGRAAVAAHCGVAPTWRLPAAGCSTTGRPSFPGRGPKVGQKWRTPPHPVAYNASVPARKNRPQRGFSAGWPSPAHKKCQPQVWSTCSAEHPGAPATDRRRLASKRPVVTHVGSGP
jgi:hypothetical protein